MKENKNKEKQKTAAKKRLSLKQREGMMGYLFVLPWIIGVLIFVLRPLAQSFNFALSRVRMTPAGRRLHSSASRTLRRFSRRTRRSPRSWRPT